MATTNFREDFSGPQLAGSDGERARGTPVTASEIAVNNY
jgi:hypothetical protein